MKLEKPKKIYPRRRMKQEVRERIEFIAKGIAEGKSKAAIKNEYEEMYPDDTSHKFNNNYYLAIDGLSVMTEKYLGNVREIQRERLETIMAGAINKKDYLSAVKAVETLNKMLGIQEQKQVVEIKDHTIKFEFGNVNNEDEENNE